MNKPNDILIDKPQCLTSYFVNKQNVRSFGNVSCAKLLKSKHDLLLHNIFEDEKDLVSLLSVEIIEILCTLKNNLMEKSREDFKNYYSHKKIGGSTLYPVDKDIVIIGCWTALCEIIPKQLFGGNHNAKIFRKIVDSVVFGMKGEHVLLNKLLEKWNYTMSPCNYHSETISIKIFYYIILWILKNVVSSVICLNFHVATSKLSTDEYKLHFFWKNEWQSFYDKQISRMVSSKIIIKHDAYSLGKKTRKSFSFNDRLKRKSLKKNIPKLYLILKNNNDCRPIVRYKNYQQSLSEKKKIRDRLYFLRILAGKQQNRIESAYMELHRKWVYLGKPPVYFVKADLVNAFGSINNEKLFKILSEQHNKFQNTEKNLQLKKRIAQLYRDFISELRAPLLIRAGSTVYEWKKGLVQGYKYSPALSELYYGYLDELYFADLLQKSSDSDIKLFSRVVDDYLYVTSSLDDAHAFLKALSNYSNVNYDKTIVNFDYQGIQKSMSMTFIGYTYDTETLQVGRASNVSSGQMCYKIAFTSAISNLHKFLENRIGQSGIPINGHIFNFHYNNEDLIWRHAFTTLCLSANKFCSILAILSETKDMDQYLTLYKKRVTVKLCNSIIEALNRTKPEETLFMYCVNHFRYLSWKALLLCAKNTPKCNSLMPQISVEMAKSNCIFGKWRDHAGRINANGTSKCAAVKEVCRRSDLRVLMKSFDVPPTGFQFYNSKSRLL